MRRVSNNSSDRRFLRIVKIKGPALNNRSTGALDGRPVLNRRKRFLIRGYLWSELRDRSLSTRNRSSSFMTDDSLEGMSMSNLALSHGCFYLLETRYYTTKVIVILSLQYIYISGQRPHHRQIFLQKSNIYFVEDLDVQFFHYCLQNGLVLLHYASHRVKFCIPSSRTRGF